MIQLSSIVKIGCFGAKSKRFEHSLIRYKEEGYGV